MEEGTSGGMAVDGKKGIGEGWRGKKMMLIMVVIVECDGGSKCEWEGNWWGEHVCVCALHFLTHYFPLNKGKHKIYFVKIWSIIVSDFFSFSFNFLIPISIAKI